MDNRNELIMDTLIPVVLFLLIGWFVYWVVNKPSIADFMIEAEGEMKKVSWSSRQEIIVSTTIVIVVVIILASFLGLVDLMFQLFFGKLFGT
jgi:preprotein translocase subunit SecE